MIYTVSCSGFGTLVQVGLKTGVDVCAAWVLWGLVEMLGADVFCKIGLNCWGVFSFRSLVQVS